MTKLMRFLPIFSFFMLTLLMITPSTALLKGPSDNGARGEIVKRHTLRDDGIIVSLKDNYLYWIHDDLIERFPVATGKSKTSTPTGHFNILDKVYNKDYINHDSGKRVEGGDSSNPYGHHFMSLSTEYNIAIHGTNQPDLVYSQSHASKGCIRMLNKHVARIYNNAPEGLPVNIVKFFKV